MSSPIIDDGAVRVERGRIVDVGRFADVARGSARVDDLGEVVLLPGLINAHVHLELSDLSPGERPASFGAWVLRNMAARSVLGDRHATTIRAAALAGAAESLRFGVTCVGDVSRDCAITRPALRDGPLRVVSFGEVLALAQRRTLLDKRLALATDGSARSDSLSIGVSPHAPYTVEPDAYRACFAAAVAGGLPICTHLAETPDEAEFLATHTGSLRAIYDALGTWDDRVPLVTGGPIALAGRVGLLDHPTLLAHVNYASDAELDTLSRGRASVAYCPRTHAYFGHPPHRWRDMLARGINVCVGTDSRASSPDLNVVDDLRLVRRQSPDVESRTLWELVTTRAAGSLGRDDVGAIAVGIHADLVAFEAASADPLDEILKGGRLPRVTWVAGDRVDA